MEPETEIVSDAPPRAKPRAAKKATATGGDKPTVTGFGAGTESAESALVIGATFDRNRSDADEPIVRWPPDEAQVEQGGHGAEGIRELEVVRIPLNPRLVLAS